MRGKADTSTVTAQLAAKADASALATKADAAAVYTKCETAGLVAEKRRELNARM